MAQSFSYDTQVVRFEPIMSNTPVTEFEVEVYLACGSYVDAQGLGKLVSNCNYTYCK